MTRLIINNVPRETLFEKAVFFSKLALSIRGKIVANYDNSFLNNNVCLVPKLTLFRMLTNQARLKL